MSVPSSILLVEDNDDDRFLIRRAFEQARIVNPLHIVPTGEEAIAYLKGEGPYVNRERHPFPELVLLDLKLPGLDGFDVLRWVRQQPALAGLRVVVLTSSTDVRDVNLAFRLGANSFIIKPADFFWLVQFSEAIAGWWLWTAARPAEGHALALELEHSENTTRFGQSGGVGAASSSVVLS